MEKALYGPYGDYINLKTFAERQGSDPQTWGIKPYCKGCGQEVHPVDVKAALGFREAGAGMLQRRRDAGRNQSAGHFSHFDGNDPTCPYANNRDAFFDLFGGDGYDYRRRDKIKEVLNSDHVKSFNYALYNRLFHILTGRPSTKYDYMYADKNAAERLSKMMILIEKPWIYPFAQIILEGKKRVQFPKGSRWLRFDPAGVQSFTFKDPFNVVRETTIPEKIELRFVNDDGSQGSVFKRGGNQPIIYRLTQKAAEEVAAQRLNFSPPKIKEKGFNIG